VYRQAGGTFCDTFITIKYFSTTKHAKRMMISDFNDQIRLIRDTDKNILKTGW
jgi:hypothetical protein